MYTSAALNDSQVIALLDTGSSITLVSEAVARKIQAALVRSTIAKGVTANGTPINLLGQFTPNLTIGYQTIQIQLLGRYQDCFVGNDGDLGRYQEPITHCINVAPHSKVPKQHRAPSEKRQEIERQIKEMPCINIIEPNTSKFASPIVLVKKGSNKDQWRFTVDYRQINAITETET
ncbi:hypothetical protein TELCIR_02502 [Teladorsagia circumcincta]|uniref:Peptidase A2 domain-containing protein n=1 Tax=Teladorsagia circumcincta TaxID=45464 RepID=A0A2G9UZ20_TELCI|nr:hypothetical protein TELCIR_02502 [Teladorsagia circumcincta]